jgi:hypothetical protein
MAGTDIAQRKRLAALTACAIRKLADYFDAGDDGLSPKLETSLPGNATYPEIAYAWMVAAATIAEGHMRGTGELRNIANKISRGIQGEFEF